MKKTLLSYAGILLLSMSFSLTASAEWFGVYGKVKRTLTGQHYGGCMVYLDTDIGHACPSRWVSLDCQGLFNGKSPETGKKMLSSAMAAAHTGNTVWLYINDVNKANGYCVARRIDVIF